MNDQGQTVYGQFVPTATSLKYTIKLNANFFNDSGATNLGKAATIIHEIMHALIASVIQNQNSANNMDINDFPAIWNAYVALETGGTTPNDHTFIGNNYVMIMASALQEYITGIQLSSGQIPQQIYQDLAWQGLFNPGAPTTPFDSVLSGADKARIMSVKEAEMSNTYYNGVYPTNNPPCVN